jgi:hypothetical protein
MMTDLTPFEAHLAKLLEADSIAGIRPVDRYAIARSVIGSGARRRSAGPFAIPRWLVPVVFAALLTILAAAALVVASRLLDRVSPVPVELMVTPTGAMAHARSGHAATLLADGRVLVTGGGNGRPEPGVTTGGLARTNLTAELYDAATETFLSTGDPVEPRLGHSSTRLGDGRVLLVGGTWDRASAELYSPRTGRFLSIGAPADRRSDHVAVRLADGTVALIGGSGDDGALLGIALPGVEIFDPATGSFRRGPTDHLLARVDPSAVLLPDGRVLVAGGVALDDTLESDAAVFEHAVIWDPSTGTVVDIGALPGTPFHPGPLVDGPVVGHVRGLASLPDGRVLLLLLDDARHAWTVQAFDPATLAFTHLADLPGRPVLDPAVLGDGRVLLGLDDATSCGRVRAAVFDPATGQTTDVGETPWLGTCNGIPDATVTVLDDGSALIAGGNTGGGETVSEAAIVRPEAATR